MRRFAAIMAAYLLGLAVISAATAGDDFDWEVWRTLPVQDGGRHKPLDTLARETFRAIASRSKLVDPATKQQLDPTELYLTLLFEWRGWDHRDKGQLELVMDWRPLYFHLQQADKWDESALLHVGLPELRSALGLAKDTNCISPRQLASVTIEDRRTERKLPFSTWADKLLTAKEAGEELNELENKGLELANRLWVYQNLRMGRSLEVLPIEGSEEQKWIPVAHLLLTRFDETTDPSGELRKIQQGLVEARGAFQNQDAAAFNRASRHLLASLRQWGARSGPYPPAHATELEVAYNLWTPFRFGWLLMLLAAIGMWLQASSQWRPFYSGALAAYVAGLTAVAIGFGLRIVISGRPPVTNMYESVVYVGAGVAVLGLVLELIYRKKYILTAAATVTTIVLVLADNCPLILDPSVRPLEPVLRSNFWLVTHVMTITLSYAAFALALGIAIITLGHYLFGSNNQGAIIFLRRFTYKAVQIGVLLLSAGVILGGVWADYSWGRFWGWDPKEVWALVALLGYLAVLHARFAGWVGHRGLAALSVACFSLVVMAWYGVNFVLGAGLHSYGFGGGGQGYVCSAVALQLLYVGVALLRSWRWESETSSESVRLIAWMPVTNDDMSVT
jgi:ABC-type transport system involved in cytochrome c biogenesis permease subunit